MKHSIWCLLFSLTLATPVMANTHFMEGRDYYRFKGDVAEYGEGKVIEFFMLGCKYCPPFHDAVTRWLNSRSDVVGYERIPMVIKMPKYNGYLRFGKLATAYYAAQKFGLADFLDQKVANQSEQKDQRDMSLDKFVRLMRDSGIRESDLTAAYTSFSAKAKTYAAARRSDELLLRTTNYTWKITRPYANDSGKLLSGNVIAKEILNQGSGVPMLVIGGRFKVSSKWYYRNKEQFGELLDYLVAQGSR